MKLVIKAALLHRTIRALVALVDEANILVTQDSLSCTCVDAANVAMASVSLDKSCFKEYQVSTKTDFYLGLDVKMLCQFIAFMGEKGDLTIEMDEEGYYTPYDPPMRNGKPNGKYEKGSLHLSNGTCSFNLDTMNPDNIRREPKVPYLELTSAFTLPGYKLKKAVEAADMVSDHMIIEFLPELGARISGDGDIYGFSRFFGIAELTDVKHGKEKSRSLYSIDYISDMLKPIVKESKVDVKIELGTDYPMMMALDYHEPGAKTVYLMAPRIESI